MTTMMTEATSHTSCPGHIPVPLRDDGSIHKAAYRELKHFGELPDWLAAEVAEWVPNQCDGQCTAEHEEDGVSMDDGEGGSEGDSFAFTYPLRADGTIDKAALRSMRPHRRVSTH